MSQPTDLSNLAELGIASGTAWINKYPTYIVDFITSAEYLALHETMRADIQEQKQTEALRRAATAELKAVNAKINAQLRNLKDYIVDEYGKENVYVHYPAYGIILSIKGYTLPVDNDTRARSLDLIVAELSKPGHPLANKKYGLAFWTAQRDTQRATWASIKSIDGKRSILSGRLTIARNKAKELQSRLRMHIRATFGDNQRSVLRDFGFQAEKYK